MSVPYRFTRRAYLDLKAIRRYIALDSKVAANRVETAILDACRMLGSFPTMGRLREEFTDKLVHFWPVPDYPNYLIIYRAETTPIHIVAIVHGMRNLQALLADPKFRV